MQEVETGKGASWCQQSCQQSCQQDYREPFIIVGESCPEAGAQGCRVCVLERGPNLT